MTTHPTERTFGILISEMKANKVKPMSVSKQAIAKLANTSKLLRSRWDQAHKFNSIETDQQAVDYVLGIDSTVNCMGYTIGIDVTSNPHTVEGKLAKLTSMKKELKELGYDKCLVVLIEQEDGWSMTTDAAKENIKQQLLRLFKGDSSEFVSEFVMQLA